MTDQQTDRCTTNKLNIELLHWKQSEIDRYDNAQELPYHPKKHYWPTIRQIDECTTMKLNI